MTVGWLSIPISRVEAETEIEVEMDIEIEVWIGDHLIVSLFLSIRMPL